MSPANSGRERASAAHLGATLRSVLVSPRAGFEGALRAMGRKERAGTRLPEGLSTYVLAATGGAALVLLWLKLSALIGLRGDSAESFHWWYLIAGCALGALLALVAQAIWGLLGPRIVARLGGSSSPRALRLVWGASAFPQVAALVLLLPADLLIVGPETFTNQAPGDPVSSVWAALSVAIAVALAVWSVCLFLLGTEVAGRVKLSRSIAAGAVAVLCLAIVLTAFRFGAVALAGAGG
ncbi:MAG: hypothetical protein QOK47_1242 [Actinomycetota bacterium]|jgi:hypothetical protein|nr:hypothetical protein [Actinomycetota bacterium]